MLTFQKLLIACFAVLFSLSSYSAESTIKVQVQASSKSVAAIGFTVNGKDHGGMGRSYSKSGMPVGVVYQFGVRVGGVFGDSVSCGSKKLSKNAMVSLNYNGKSCSLRVKTMP